MLFIAKEQPKKIGVGEMQLFQGTAKQTIPNQKKKTKTETTVTDIKQKERKKGASKVDKTLPLRIRRGCCSLCLRRLVLAFARPLATPFSR